MAQSSNGGCPLRLCRCRFPQNPTIRGEVLRRSSVQDSSKKNKTWRSKQRLEKQAVEKTGVEIRDQMDDNFEGLDMIIDFKVADSKLEKNLLETDLAVQPLMDNPEMDVGSIEYLSEGNGNKEKRRKRNKKKKAIIKNEVQNMDQTTMYTRSTENLLETDLTVRPVADNLRMDAGSIENLSEGNANKEKKESPKGNREKMATIEDESQSMDQTMMDTRVIENGVETDLSVQPLADNPKMDADSIENLSVEENANMEKKKRWKRNKKKKVAIKDEVQSMDQTPVDTRSIKNVPETDSTVEPQADNPKMDAGSTENLSEMNANKKKRPKRKRKKKKKKKATILYEVQSMDQTTHDTKSKEILLETDLTTTVTRSKENLLETDVTAMSTTPKENLLVTDVTTMGARSKENLLEANLAVQLLADSVKKDAGSIENLSEGSVNKQKKRNRNKKKKKATIMDEVQGQTTMDGRSKENLLETDLILHPLAENPKTEVGSIEALAYGDGIQTTNQTTVDTGSTGNLVEGNMIGKRKRKKKSNKAQIIGANQSVEQTKMSTESTENLAEGNVTSKRKRKRKSKKAKNKCTSDMNNPSISLPNLVDKPLDLCKHEGTVLSPNVVEGSCYKASSGLAQERCGPLAQPRELEGKLIPCESQHIGHTSLITEQDNEIILYKGKGSAEGRSSLSACKVKVSTYFSSSTKDADHLYPKMTPCIPIRRKLLVLDVNGLLADIVQPAPKDCRGDIHILGRAIFKRPFCSDFLTFCFQNFDVGIWSSRSMIILDRVLDYLLGDLKQKLLFCWDKGRCTQTGFKTLENKHKALVCKELTKIWGNNSPKWPWKKGDYNESNTLLLDDSPYKALLNPLHTAIFPHSYSYMDKNDNSLGPGGNLRVYLEGLLTCENVQKYVEQYPFGQSSIDEKSFSWGFYAGVLHCMEQKKKKTNHSTHMLIH